MKIYDRLSDGLDLARQKIHELTAPPLRPGSMELGRLPPGCYLPSEREIRLEKALQLAQSYLRVVARMNGCTDAMKSTIGTGLKIMREVLEK